MRLATAAQMREIDRRAIEEFGIPGIVLMENAAVRIADEIGRRCKKPRFKFAAVCGPGNNGGDGIAVARHLVARYGACGVIWLCYEQGAKTSPDHALNLRITQSMVIAVRTYADEEFGRDLQTCDIVVDAMLGTGAKGAPRAMMADAIRAINSYRMSSGEHLTVAIDSPTGVDSDTGAADSDEAVYADLTVTLGLSKIGLHLDPGYRHAGDTVVADLCLPPQIVDNAGLLAMVADREFARSVLPSREDRRDSNKATYGAVALIAGSQGFAGAPTLCCHGALRAGAGLVTLGVPEGLLDVMMARLPDEVMTRGFLDTGGRQFRSAAAPQVLDFTRKMDAVGIGPGIGSRDQETRTFVRDVVADCTRPMVIDADALNCLSQEPDRGASLVKARKAPTILTPHPGEMARLLGIDAKQVQADRLGCVRRAAEQYGCVALLKGDRTLIAAPDGRLAINETGNAGMAGGGMGDTLTGIATVLLAQIKDPFDAAATAAFVHGLAGDLAAEAGGRAGLTARDLAAHLPAALKDCMSEGCHNG